MRFYNLSDTVKGILVHIAPLPHAEMNVIMYKHFIVLQKNLVGCLIRYILARFKHLVCDGININTGNIRKCVCGILIGLCACGRTERQRVRQNGTAQNARHIRLDFNTIFTVHFINYGRRASDRLISEIHRSRRFKTAHTVMVDNFKHLGLFYTVDALGFFVMVDKDKLFSLQIKKVSAGYNADIF